MSLLRDGYLRDAKAKATAKKRSKEFVPDYITIDDSPPRPARNLLSNWYWGSNEFYTAVRTGNGVITTR